LLCLAIQPQGLFSGCLALVRPPFGWSTGFMATPLTQIFLNLWIEKPHFPSINLLLKKFVFLPIKHFVFLKNRYLLREGNSTNISLTVFFAFNFVIKVPPDKE
jgi:hypothetical protein